MPKLIEQKNYFTFVAGLNTEASYLTSPPNTWREGFNVIPDVTGELTRRKGIDFESGYVLSSSDNANSNDNLAQTVGEWNSVAGDGTRNFLVVQRGTTVYFYDNKTGASSTTKSFTINLLSHKVVGNIDVDGFNSITVASGNGKLIIVSSEIEPLLVTYDPDTDTISVEELDIKIRDFEGVDDGLEIDERPVTLSAAHEYNLHNQGWPSAHITSYKTSSGFYPSNAQIWTVGKDASDVFSPTLLDKQDFGTTPAPRGRFVLDVFNRNRSAESGVGGITTEIEFYRPTTVAFFAGRAWFAGIRSDKIASWIMFSQVADTTDRYGNCYQDADPTSEFISDIVDSDGGVIPIQDIGTILKLLPLNNSMLILADNGIWQIVGTDRGFSATSYSVNKISSIGCVSAKSVVEVETTAMFWGVGGIYAFSQESNLASLTAGTFSVVSVTDSSIKSFYSDIPVVGKTHSSGQYNSEEKIIYWGFNNSSSQNGSSNRFRKDTLLCFDVRLKAFYAHSISALASNSPYILDLFITKGIANSTVVYDVIAGPDMVVAGPDSVIASVIVSVAVAKKTRFWVEAQQGADSYKYTVADLDNTRTTSTRWKDWYTTNTAGVNVIPYIITGFELTNMAGSRQLQGTYCLAYCKKMEEGTDVNNDPVNPGSVMLQVRWDWTDTITAGRWTEARQVYRHKRYIIPTGGPLSTLDTGYGLVVTKNKIRGYGRALQFKWEGESDKDFQLAGWAVLYLAEENI